MESKSFLNVGSICHEENNFIFDYELFPFWDSFMYDKAYFKNKKRDKNFKFYDECTVFKYLFFNWVYKWATYISKGYNESYKLHPLPVSDQILYWQPIFSKHVSDGLVKLESYQTRRYHSSRVEKKYHPYRSILIRAIFLTFWRRTFFGLIGIILTNILSTSIAILVKKLLVILNDQSINLVKTLLLLFSIIAFNLIDGLATENITFYLYRLIYIIQCVFSITVFQVGMSHRRNYFNIVDGANSLNVCNQVLHTCSPDSNCSKNFFYCPALRYQSKDISARMIPFQFSDCYYISMCLESILYIVDFVSSFISGIFLVSYHFNIKSWILYVLGCVFLFVMIFIEIVNVFVFKSIFHARDYRISKQIEIIYNLQTIVTMSIDDIALNIITECRNNELFLFLIRSLLAFSNTALYIIFTNITFYILKSFFVKKVHDTSVISDVDTEGFIATFYILLQIADSMFLIPNSLRIISSSYVSYVRVKKYINKCSPNFYIRDNQFTGKTEASDAITSSTDELPMNTVVFYKDATFSWVYSRDDFVNNKYETFLKNVNFELKRGEIAIVTGAQGSGKSNFIKSILGEMTLVGGSMAVVPLHTSMPIFYASQDIWLQHGTIRSNITFGYRFDEQIYNTVLKAVELQSDISTWEKGDLRVVSDNAHTLSGGQRVRMEMARAIYAYLVFHKVNEQYNDSKCSFLICLDSSFHGLDPYVARSIFSNLFSTKNGLLVQDDVSVVLSFTKKTLATCLDPSELKQLPNPPIYNIKNELVKFHSNLHDFIRNKAHSDDEFKYLSSPRNGPYHMNYLTRDMLSLCSSGATTRVGRREQTRSKYNNSFKSFVKDELSGVKFNPYIVYMKPALTIFVIFIILTMMLTVMDNVKFVLSTNLSDFITKNIDLYKEGGLVDFDKVKARCKFSLFIILIIISIIIVLAVLSTVLFSISCIISSRKIHEYCINSIFKNSSSVIKIKKQVSQIITYLSCDVDFLDDDLPFDFYLAVVSFIQMLIDVATLFYFVPFAIVFTVFTFCVFHYFVFNHYLKSYVNIQFGYIEAITHINDVFDKAIYGSSTYRSFKKESELNILIAENNEYFNRHYFMFYSIATWGSVMFTWLFSFNTMMILVTPLVLNKYFNKNVKIGDFGLALSLLVDVMKTYTNFSLRFARMTAFMCSVQRFQYFIPPGQKVKFDKSINSHEEYILNPESQEASEMFKKQMLKRRVAEFKSDDLKFRGLRRLFFNPKINVLNIEHYITPEHTGVELNDVCVYTSPDHNPDGMILKHLTVSAHKSEIIGMVGRTGAGKTTLLSVLQNIVPHRTGQVILDGKDLNDIPKTLIRQIIGVLPQLPFVFKGWTIRRFLDPRRIFTDEEINNALMLCGLLDFVDDLQGGKKLDTIIISEDISLSNPKKKTTNKNPYPSKSFKSERSLTTECLKSYYIDSDMLLSNTQLRTLAFTRLVLYRRFYRIILVDEPPSDNISEGPNVSDVEIGVPIYELLQKYFRHCTTFVTAHDDNALSMCSSVWVVHKGSLIMTYGKEEIGVTKSISSIIQSSSRSSSM